MFELQAPVNVTEGHFGALAGLRQEESTRQENGWNQDKVYLTGDTHGRFDRVIRFCEKQMLGQDSTVVILGDAGLNYYGNKRDRQGKKLLANLQVTVFCIHGNHELRPSVELGYELREYRGGKVWVEPAFPNIMFAIDGEVYQFADRKCLVIGGAYSVDKFFRLEQGLSWFADEQPSEEIKRRVEQVLSDHEWRIDTVFSHTCPLKYEPTEAFLPMIDQSSVDKSTELWLDEIEEKLLYDRWYCGHYHIDKGSDKIRLMFRDFALLPRLNPFGKQ